MRFSMAGVIVFVGMFPSAWRAVVRATWYILCIRVSGDVFDRSISHERTVLILHTFFVVVFFWLKTRAFYQHVEAWNRVRIGNGLVRSRVSLCTPVFRF